MVAMMVIPVCRPMSMRTPYISGHATRHHRGSWMSLALAATASFNMVHTDLIISDMMHATQRQSAHNARHPSTSTDILVDAVASTNGPRMLANHVHRDSHSHKCENWAKEQKNYSCLVDFYSENSECLFITLEHPPKRTDKTNLRAIILRANFTASCWISTWNHLQMKWHQKCCCAEQRATQHTSQTVFHAYEIDTRVCG